jgi:hypothetical protein
MVLSDRTIREEVAAGRIGLDPFDPALVQPSSVDVRCDHRFRVFHPGRYPFIDVRVPMPDLTELVEIDSDRAFILHPGEFVLGATFEVLRLPDDLVARLRAPHDARRSTLRRRRSRLEVPGPARPDGERVLAQLRAFRKVSVRAGAYPTGGVHFGYRGKEVVGILSSGLCSESPASGGARR